MAGSSSPAGRRRPGRRPGACSNELPRSSRWRSPSRSRCRPSRRSTAATSFATSCSTAPVAATASSTTSRRSAGTSTRPLVVVVAPLDPRPDIGDAGPHADGPRHGAGAVRATPGSRRRAPGPDGSGRGVRLKRSWPWSAATRRRRSAPIVDRLVHAVSGDGGGGRRSFATGVSRVIADPQESPRATSRPGARCTSVGSCRAPSAVAHFDDLGAFRLLSLIEDANELRNFVNEVLGDLAHETDPEAADMRPTLRVLLDTNFNVAETSRRLHFHYNTLRYRITQARDAGRTVHHRPRPPARPVARPAGHADARASESRLATPRRSRRGCVANLRSVAFDVSTAGLMSPDDGIAFRHCRCVTLCHRPRVRWESHHGVWPGRSSTTARRRPR